VSSIAEGISSDHGKLQAAQGQDDQLEAEPQEEQPVGQEHAQAEEQVRASPHHHRKGSEKCIIMGIQLL
jgi:hypothetical protein